MVLKLSTISTISVMTSILRCNSTPILQVLVPHWSIFVALYLNFWCPFGEYKIQGLLFIWDQSFQGVTGLSHEDVTPKPILKYVVIFVISHINCRFTSRPMVSSGP